MNGKIKLVLAKPLTNSIPLQFIDNSNLTAYKFISEKLYDINAIQPTYLIKFLTRN